MVNYLRELVLTYCPDTLLAFLVDQGYPTIKPSDFPWIHPQFGVFPKAIRAQLIHANNFSEAIHGSALLYNLMLAEKAQLKAATHDFRNRLRKWAISIEERGATWENWNRAQFWELATQSNPGISRTTQWFIEHWLMLALEPGQARRIAENAEARQLLHGREVVLKRGLARLENQRALESWMASGEAGTGQLDYRWRQVQRIVQDIQIGLGRKAR